MSSKKGLKNKFLQLALARIEMKSELELEEAKFKTHMGELAVEKAKFKNHMGELAVELAKIVFLVLGIIACLMLIILKYASRF